ncbi:MAG: RNA-binding protein [Candidatus Aenigmarchaeota archaeon]|nr:RNA-binding protein [Candidatus Aenigmarchaeota archaeon]
MEENGQAKRKLVIVGEVLGDGKAGHGAYEEHGRVHAKYIGLAEQKGDMHVVIPLTGIYNPKRGDGVIGKIADVIFSKWLVDINSPYEAVLPLSEATDEFIDMTRTDLTKYFDYGEVIFAEISNVSKTKNVQLSMKNRKCRKLRGGRLIKVTPAKVPRIIGKSGSMVEMIKELTGTQIVVGQNGIVWVKGDNEHIAVEAIHTIEEMSHVSGLTDRIKDMLTTAMGTSPRAEAAVDENA